MKKLITIEEWKTAGKNGQPAWCYHNNNPENGVLYGKLYNWYAVNDPRGLAPEGCKIPSDEDWSVLIDFLGGESVAGKKMKYTDLWADYKGQSGNGTNESGFSGLPSGTRSDGGIFDFIGEIGPWWSSSVDSEFDAWSRLLTFDYGGISRGSYYLQAGFSVRCLRD